MTPPRSDVEVLCVDCGMVCASNEYHPYAACLMFKACLSGDTVRANLQAVVAHGADTAAIEVMEGKGEPQFYGVAIIADETLRPNEVAFISRGKRTVFRLDPAPPQPNEEKGK